MPRTATPRHQHRVDAGILFDAALNELAQKYQRQTLGGNDAQHLATVVARTLGIEHGPLNQRCRIAITGKAVNSWNNHVKYQHGLPGKYGGQPLRIIETHASNQRLQKPLVTVNQADNATLRFPGIPPIRLYSCRPLPNDQPTYTSASVDGRQIQA